MNTTDRQRMVRRAYSYSNTPAHSNHVEYRMTMTEKLHGKKPAKVFHTNEVKRG